MGTAGIVHFHEKGIDTEIICHVYKQSDGYPDGLGDQIKDCLGDGNLVNGIRHDLENQINGMGCAAAQFVAAVKERVGGIYMLKDAEDWADYDYHLFHEGEIPNGLNPPGFLRMRVMSGKEILWEGRLSEFDGEALYDE